MFKSMFKKKDELSTTELEKGWINVEPDIFEGEMVYYLSVPIDDETVVRMFVHHVEDDEFCMIDETLVMLMNENLPEELLPQVKKSVFKQLEDAGFSIFPIDDEQDIEQIYVYVRNEEEILTWMKEYTKHFIRTELVVESLLLSQPNDKKEELPTKDPESQKTKKIEKEKLTTED